MCRKLLFSVVCAFFMAASGLAKADSLYYLNQDGCSGNCAMPSSGYYGTVDLAQSGSNVNVTVQLYVGSNSSAPEIEFIQTGSHQTFAFYNPSVTSTSQITNVAFSPTASDSLSANVTQSGFGSFSIGINCTSCGKGSSNYPNDPTELTFTVDNVSLSSFGANSKGTAFTADVYDSLSSNTGPIGAGVPSTPEVPEPSSLLLLGTGLAALLGGLNFKFLRQL
ncbi:MAG: PEP-CTERM sorting domain-containing protein [Terracidiphilus sp.]